MADHYLIARHGNLLPTAQEIEKYGKKDSGDRGLSIESLEKKAERCFRFVEKNYPRASKEEKKTLINRMMHQSGPVVPEKIKFLDKAYEVRKVRVM